MFSLHPVESFLRASERFGKRLSGGRPVASSAAGEAATGAQRPHREHQHEDDSSGTPASSGWARTTGPRVVGRRTPEGLIAHSARS